MSDNPSTDDELQRSERTYALAAFDITAALLKNGIHHIETLRVLSKYEGLLPRHVRTMERAGKRPLDLLSKIIPESELPKEPVPEETIPPAQAPMPEIKEISLLEFVGELGVPVKHRSEAIQYTAGLIRNNDATLRLNSRAVRGGHRINFSPGIVEYLEPMFREHGFFVDGRKRKVEVLEAKPVEAEQKNGEMISLTKLMDVMEVPIKHRSRAIHHVTEMIDKGDSYLKEKSAPARGGYRVSTTNGVEAYLTPILEKEGLFERLRGGRKSTMEAKSHKKLTAIAEVPLTSVRPPARWEEITLTPKAVPRVSDSSYETDLGGVYLRLSAAALDEIKSGEPMQALRESEIQGPETKVNLVKMLREAVKRRGELYLGTGHESFLYEDSNVRIGFTIAHGTVTSISAHKKRY